MEDSLLRSVSGNASANQKTSTSTIPQNLDRIVKNQFVLKHVVLLFTPVIVMLGSMVITLILYYYGLFTIENDFITYVVLTTLTCFLFPFMRNWISSCFPRYMKLFLLHGPSTMDR